MILNLLKGNLPQVEQEIYALKRKEATQALKDLIEQVANCPEGRQIARKLQQKYGYRDMRRLQVSITTMVGDVIKVTSWYARRQGKKLGRFKRGRNGRGMHLLLKYWGFSDKNSFNYETRVARLGAACGSYELAQTELAEQEVLLSADRIDDITQRIGEQAAAHRDAALENNESFKDKRIMIAIDGGRVRTRQARTGRRQKGQKLAKYQTNWREPKLLVVSELDEQGNKPKGAKPIYEATMKDHDHIFTLLENLAAKCHLAQAQEIILSADGAAWIWQGFGQFREKFKLARKTTEILDFYHAAEHLTAIAQANTELNAGQRQAWLRQLKQWLLAGEFQQLKDHVSKESTEKKLPALLELWQYFENNSRRLNYAIYQKNKQPIGSGIVESAVRRVINLKLKSPGSFWKIDRLEKVLRLRCILMSGRWNTFKKNLLKVNQITV